MSKKKKNQPKEAKQEFETQVLLEEVSEESAKEVAEETQKFHCAEAAEKIIAGYQSRWLASIKTFAEHEAMTSNHSLEEWEALFVKWGAKIK